MPLFRKRCQCPYNVDQKPNLGNGKDIKRCEAGGSCVPNQRLGAIVFAVPALEHAGFVGSRGGGVVIEAAKLQKNLYTVK